MKRMLDNIKECITVYSENDSDMPSERPTLQGKVSTGHNRGIMGISGNIKPFIIKKRWGEERVFQNNNKYCSKLLIIRPHKHTSMHFHIDKHETMVVLKGTLYIDYNNNKKVETAKLNQYESFVIAPGLPHKLRAGKEEVHLMEASTPSHDNDSIRTS